MSIQEDLTVVLQKVAQNRVNVNAALVQSRLSLTQADAEAVEAAKVLIKKFSNPQGAMQIVQDVYQSEALADTSREMDAMLAGIETVLGDSKVLESAAAQLKARAETTNSPLSGATGVNSSDSVVDAGANSEAAPVTA